MQTNSVSLLHVCGKGTLTKNTMRDKDLPEFQRYFLEWREQLESLRQNSLLSEGSLISFASNRGFPVRGVIKGDPGDFHRLGLLKEDELYEGAPQFHPFRLYPLHRILKWRRTFGSLDPVGGQTVIQWAKEWNAVADLAILLEPLYWPDIIGHATFEVHERGFERYHRQVLGLLKTLDPAEWQKIHEDLRREAGWIDGNEKLYVLLRLSSWSERKDLHGNVGGALWIRHIAEVIRRSFEEVHLLQWLEEDRAFGHWAPGGRKYVFGSERPLDEPFRSKPYIARAFGLFTGSSVRWYVEGDTEYHAVLEILPEPSLMGIELVNLHGAIKSGLQENLKEDQAFHRFSMVTFDRDVPANVAAVRRQAQEDNIVGMIEDNDPDFEFANFSLSELVEIAARINEEQGASGDPVRNANWSAITNGKEFENLYRNCSARNLKGAGWGRALARYALEHPRRGDSGSERRLWQQFRGALNAWMSSYDTQRERFMFDPTTFQLTPRPANRRPSSG